LHYGTAPASFSCATGTLSGTDCLSTEYTSVLYQCGSGTLSGSDCLVDGKAPATHSCTIGTLSGTDCLYDDEIGVLYQCITGTLSGSECLTDVTSNVTYSCETGTLEGQQCSTTHYQPKEIDTCPTGYFTEGTLTTMCYKRTNTNALASCDDPFELNMPAYRCEQITTMPLPAQ
jgi:hypothetical protein